MLAGAIDWASRFFGTDAALQKAEQVLRVKLDWTGSRAARRSLLARLQYSVGGLDLLDYCLYLCDDWDFGDDEARELQGILHRSGSAWRVAAHPAGRYCLEQRVDPTVEEAARSEMAQESNAATYLSSAWHHAYRRDPDPSRSYSDSIKAVEAAARPVVTPKDQLATLGKMIAAMRDKPQKWGTVIGDVDTVRIMMDTIWKAQVDRHGTDDPQKPLTVSQSEAEAAVQFAATLVQLFRTGAIRGI
ncbi:MAG: hypothetical protein OXI84_00465 [bacterium]|nr:hypothetical protein [bacterium]